MSNWLKQLKQFEIGNSKLIEEIYFNIGGFSNGYDEYRITFHDSSAKLIKKIFGRETKEKYFSLEEARKLQETFNNIHVEYWNCEYMNPFILDGTQWTLAVKYRNKRGQVWTGSNAFPPNWSELLSFFNIKQ